MRPPVVPLTPEMALAAGRQGGGPLLVLVTTALTSPSVAELGLHVDVVRAALARPACAHVATQAAHVTSDVFPLDAFQLTPRDLPALAILAPAAQHVWRSADGQRLDEATQFSSACAP